MNKNRIISAGVVLSLVFGIFGPVTARAAGHATVNLGSAGNFVILSKAGISTTGATAITGVIGVSPIVATAITGFGLTMDASNVFSLSSRVTGKVYAADYTAPTPANMTTAVGDMQTAYTDAMGRASTVTELGAGNIGGLTLVPGVYKWGTGLSIPTDVTLSGGANDVWIFQIAQNLNLSPAVKIILSGGAQASNIFWVVAGQTTIGTTAVFNGNILDQTAIVLNTGATLNGRALAQTAVTLDSSIVNFPEGSVSVTPAVPATPATPAVPTINPAFPAIPATPAVPVNSTVVPVILVAPVVPAIPVACTQEVTQCPDGSYVGRTGQNCEFSQCPEIYSIPAVPAVSVIPAFGEKIRMITTNLKKGNKNDNVATLQQFLISHDAGSAAKHLGRAGATSYFGPITRAALAEFQASVGISPAWGNFGSITRAYISAQYN